MIWYNAKSYCIQDCPDKGKARDSEKYWDHIITYIVHSQLFIVSSFGTITCILQDLVQWKSLVIFY